MSYGRDRGSDSSDILFHSQDGFATQRAILEQVGQEVDAIAEARILNTDPEELISYFVEKFRIDVPVLDVDSISASEHERNIEVHDRYAGEMVTVPGVAFEIEVPFSGDGGMFRISSNSSDSGPPRAKVGNGVLKFAVQGRSLTAEQVKEAVDRTVGSVQKYLGWQRAFWAGYDKHVAAKAREHIDRRRARLLQQKGVAAGLAGMGFKLKEKPGDPKTYVAPAVKQRIQPQMPPMRAATPPDPTLDRGTYETILGLIRGSGRSIEQSSSRTRNLDEEALRDMLLVPLNAHFGSATGESFNATGKTDILIKHEGGNLFVAECKFWHGEKQFLETIDQLLGYLTWRDTKTAVIMFNRNIGFSGVVEQIRALPQKHARYVSGPKKLDESSFEFTLSLPNDSERHVTVSVMAFDLGPKAP